MKNSILVISDSEDQNYTAILQAAELAKAYKCNLHIVNFCYEVLRGFDKTDVIKSNIIGSLHELSAHKLVNTLQGVIEYEFETIWEKDIHFWVNRYVDEHKPFMVVKTGHRSEALLYTPTDWHLLRECQAPVLIAADHKWHNARNVLATIDLDTLLPEKKRLNQKVLEHASILAKHINAELHICYAIPYSPVLKTIGLMNKKELEQINNDNFADDISLLATNYGIDHQNIHIKAGEVSKVITSVAADCKASLVVVGTVGRTGVEQKFIGNTAESIMHLAKTDLLAIKL
ncbi:universal stress protein [Colwelliaceae bacterium BS250]